MKKLTLFFIAFLSVYSLSAQVKITFEDESIGSSGGVTPVWSGGTCDVAANTYTTGNSSSKVLHVQNNGYLGLYFSNVPLPANAITAYSKIRFKILIVGGSDVNYPTLEIFSAPNSWTMGATEKIGSLSWSQLWGNAELEVWKTIEFNLSDALLNPTPAGSLILKLSKSNTEYLIDDVELVALPTTTNGYFIVNDFETASINDVLTMKRWAVADGTATVEANPADNTNKSAHIVTSNYDAILKQTVALPTGKTLADYEKIMFDIYLVAGASNNYKKMQIYLDGVKYYEDASYPSQATDATWTTKEYSLTATSANSFVVDLGISTNGGNYYFDNIKLKEKVVSGINSKNDENSFFVYSTQNAFVFNQEVDMYQLYNLQGKLISKGVGKSFIENSNINSGVYILKIVSKENTFLTKVVK